MIRFNVAMDNAYHGTLFAINTRTVKMARMKRAASSIVSVNLLKTHLPRQNISFALNEQTLFNLVYPYSSTFAFCGQHARRGIFALATQLLPFRSC